jgi:hypothetical protein
MLAEKSSSNVTKSRLKRIIFGGLLAGMLLVASPILLRSRFGEPTSYALKLAYGLMEAFGVATLVATLVGFSFEILLSQERADEHNQRLKEHHDRIKHFEEFGFKTIYPSRQEIFDEILHDRLSQTKNELKIMGICVSLFKESERHVAARPEPDQVVDALASMAVKGCKIQVLFLQRYPSKELLDRYGNPSLDLFYMREHDEDEKNTFERGKRLKKIANRSLGDWIKVVLRIAEKTRNSSVNDRREALSRLEIREYLALPSVSVYVLDEDIFVAPYLFRRHCSSVPGFKVSDKKRLYQEYYGHFVATWNDPLTTRTIPLEFIELLVNQPESTLKDFESMRQKISAGLQEQIDFELPEYYQEMENTVKTLVEGSKKAAKGRSVRME